MKTNIQKLDIDIKKMTLTKDDVLVVKIPLLKRMTKQKSEEYINNIRYTLKSIIDNKCICISDDVELLILSKEKGE